MPVTLVLHGDGTGTVNLMRTMGVPKIEALGNAAAHRLYDAGRYVPLDVDDVAVPWDDLTNLQKLGILGDFAFDMIHEEAMGYMHEVRGVEARSHRAEDAATIR